MTTPLRRPGSGTLEPPYTSEVENDSGVAGVTCSDALDTLAAAIPAITYGVPVVTGTANAAGAATSLSRSDHVHQTAGSDSVPNQSGVSGAAVSDALDILAGLIPTIAYATPVATAAANAQGVATTLARSDHVHQTAGTTSVPNQSAVSGTTATDALNALRIGKIGRIVRTLITATGAGLYTPTAGMLYVTVTGTGGGGSGGGADTDGTASAVATAGGGSAAGTFQKTYSAADIGASQAYVVGARGVAGTSGTDGNPGADTTFMACTASGGLAGLGSGVNTAVPAMAVAAVAGGAATGGDINIAGGLGHPGSAASSATCTWAESGAGGQSWWGAGGAPRRQAQASTTTDLTQQGSNAGAGHYGAGGGGAVDLTAATGVIGGLGIDGCLLFEEYISV
jgi:hypothetical protein